MCIRDRSIAVADSGPKGEFRTENTPCTHASGPKTPNGPENAIAGPKGEFRTGRRALVRVKEGERRSEKIGGGNAPPPLDLQTPAVRK